VRARAASLRRARDLLVRARPRCAPKVVPPPQTTSPTRTTAPPQSSQVIDVGADPAGNLRFVQTSLTATAGAMTIRFTNPSGVPHNVGITGPASVGTTATVSNGGVVNLEANLPPGTYTLFCGVGQHAELGMSIPLIVT
jgi:plastocyanin